MSTNTNNEQFIWPEIDTVKLTDKELRAKKIEEVLSKCNGIGNRNYNFLARELITHELNLAEVNKIDAFINDNFRDVKKFGTRGVSPDRRDSYNLFVESLADAIRVGALIGRQQAFEQGKRIGFYEGKKSVYTKPKNKTPSE